MHRMPKIEDIKTVEKFFDQWSIYRKAVDNDYMLHNQVYGKLKTLFVGRLKKGFAILDLGCGDAEFMAKALKGTRVKKYVGVDISGVVLELAKKNMRSVRCRKTFILSDFLKDIKYEKRADIIWMSLAFHHLRRKQKIEFFKRCYKACRDEGCLVLYEPVMKEDEDRKAFLKRWIGHCNKYWKAFTIKEMALIRKHIRYNDFPEKFSVYSDMARMAGFSHSKKCFIDHARVNTVMAFYKFGP